MRSSRFLLVAGVAAARAVVTLILALGFWAAAPVALGWQPTTVMTASMTPAIDVGDVVVSRPVPRDALLPGRVVLAVDPDRPDRLRLHRVADLASDGDLITKGDANPAPDSSPLRPDAVVGVGVLRVPWIGMPIVWLRTGEVLPLAAAAVGFALCLATALRRGEDDPDPTPPPPGSAGETPLSRRARRHAQAATPIPLTRRARRGLGLTAATVLALGIAASPAWATLTAASATAAGITAGRLAAPSSLGCVNDSSGAIVTWAYEGWAPRGFDLLVNGEVVAGGIAPGARAARVPNDGSFSLFRTDRVTVRSTIGDAWSAESTASVPVGGVLFGFGRPFCR